ncbi:MAG TPA: DUF1579 family protein [Gemmatimonadaceae bacterium]
MTDATISKPPQRSAAHRQLDVFVGSWRARGESFGEGQQVDNPRASPAVWTSEESYEWLPGGFFMLHKWDARVGTHGFRGIEIIGHDAAAGGYFTRMFDNAGNHPEYVATVSGNVWTFSEPSTRATVSVSADGNRMDLRWEWRQGDGEWLPLCDRTANRVR